LQSEISYDATGTPSLSFGLGKLNNSELSLDEIFQYLQKTDTPCIIAIDEFQQVTKYPESNVEALMRTYVQQCPRTRFIFSGSQQHLMGEMFTSAARPFFASTSMLHLEPIKIGKYIDFAQKCFTDAGKAVEQSVIQKIYSDFEGISWYIQKILNRLFTVTGVNEICKAEDVEETLQYIIESFEYNYSDMIFRLPDKQSKLLIAIAKDQNVLAPTSSDFVKRHKLVSASSVQSALNGLLEKEFVTRNEAGYSVYDKFFDKWLREKYAL
jgi:hypothetical protein